MAASLSATFLPHSDPQEHVAQAGIRSTEQTDGNGLVYLRARHYAPSLGIFPSLDPFEGVWDDPMTLNRYGYVQGDPTNLIDPSGLQSCTAVSLTGANLDRCINQAGGGGGSSAAVLLGLLTLLGILRVQNSGTVAPPTTRPGTHPDVYRPGVNPFEYPRIWQRPQRQLPQPPNGPSWLGRLLAALTGAGLGFTLWNIIEDVLCPQPQPQQQPQPQPTSQSELPIVLDLGGGANLPEILAILAYRLNHKVVLIDQGDDGVEQHLRVFLNRSPESLVRNVANISGVMLNSQNIDLGRLEVIVPGDYSDPGILNGRKAKEMISMYPNPNYLNSATNLAAAAVHHLEPGGIVYIATENASLFDRIYVAMQNVGVSFNEQCTRSPRKGGVSGSEIATGNNCTGIPLYSIHGNSGTVYDMYGYKRG